LKKRKEENDVSKKQKLFYDLADVIHFEGMGSLSKCNINGEARQTILTHDGYSVVIDFTDGIGEIVDIIDIHNKSVIREIQPWKFEEVRK
jgi:hypothetical protein